MRKFLQWFVLLMLIGIYSFSQNRIITGTVRDENNGPIPFATITETGIRNATTADANGVFTIKLKDKASITITATGFIMHEQLVTGNNISVTLKPTSNSLTEVIVTTALGRQMQAKNLGYSTAKVKTAELNQANVVNIPNGLTGKVSGLNITTVNNGVFANTKINLRGIRSLTGNNQPLLVLDGIPTPIGYINSINPNDVQEVSILKGASAAALYGPDGANGVIIVSTKRGSKGKPSVTVSHTTQIEKVSYLPEMQREFGSGSTVDGNGDPLYTPFENQQYGPRFDGSLRPIGKPLADGSVQMVTYEARPDEKLKFWNTGVTNQDAVSFSTEGFYLSAQHVGIKGVTPDDENKRTSFRLNASKDYGRFRASFNVSYVQSNANIVNNAAYKDRFASSYNGSVYFTVLNTPMQIPLTSYKDQTGYGNYDNYYNEFFVSPYWAISSHRQKIHSDDVLGNIELNYKIANWLTATYRLGINADFRTFKNETSPISVSDYSIATRGQQYRNQPGSVQDGESMIARITSEFFLSGKKDINSFSLSYTAGTRFRQNSAKDVKIGGNNLVVPYVFNVSNRTGELSGLEANSKDRLLSFFANVGVSYLGWANLEATVANDRDSRLAYSNNSFWYPGVSASLILTDAISSLKNNRVLSYAKIRGAISKSGNVNLPTYALEATYNQSLGFPYGSLGGFSAGNTKPDPSIKPEFVNSMEVGFEVGFLKNRINFEATYFNQKNTNQILTVQQSSATGYPNKLANTADFVNQGIEMDLRLTPLIRIGSGRFDLSVNATYNNSEIISLANDINELAIGGANQFTQRAASSPNVFNYAIVGQPAFVFKLSDYKRDPEGRVIVDRNTGNPALSDSLITRGRTQPLWIVGINPSFSYKGFTISATIDYRAGHYAYFGLGSDMDFTGISARSAQYNRQRFVFPNSVYIDGSKYVPNENIQVSDGGVNFWTSGALNSAIATNYFASAASWKLRELAIGYEIPITLLGRQEVIKKLNVMLTGRNLFTWLPQSNQWTDPEFNFTDAGNSNGLSSTFETPPTRIFGASIIVTF